MTTRKRNSPVKNVRSLAGYTDVLADVVHLLEAARRTAARTVNVVMTTTLLGDRKTDCGDRAERSEASRIREVSPETFVNGFDYQIWARFLRT